MGGGEGGGMVVEKIDISLNDVGKRVEHQSHFLNIHKKHLHLNLTLTSY